MLRALIEKTGVLIGVVWLKHKFLVLHGSKPAAPGGNHTPQRGAEGEICSGGHARGGVRVARLSHMKRLQIIGGSSNKYSTVCPLSLDSLSWHHRSVTTRKLEQALTKLACPSFQGG